MATIAELVLKLSGDNTQLRQTLVDSAQATQKFADSATASMSTASEAIQRQAVDYTQLTARAMDFARAGASAAQIVQMAGVSMVQASEAVKLFSNTIAKAEIDVGGLRAAQAQMSMVGMLPGVERITDATRRMTLMQMEAIAMNEKLAASNVAVGASANAAGMGFNMAGLGMGRLRQSLASGIAMMTGMPPIIARIGSTVGVMFAGMGEVVVAMAAIGALIWIWDKLTEATKKATEAIDKAVASMEELTKLKGPELMMDNITKGTTRVQELTHNLSMMASVAAELATNPVTQILLGFVQSRINTQGQALADLTAGITAQWKELLQTDRDVATREREGRVHDLEALLKYNKDDHEARVQLIAQRSRDLAQLKQLSAGPDNPVSRSARANLAGEIGSIDATLAKEASSATKEYYEQLGVLIERLNYAKSAHQGYADVLTQIIAAYSKLGGNAALATGAALPGEKPEDLKRRLDMLKELSKTMDAIVPKINIKEPGFNTSKIIDSIIPDIIASLDKAATTPGPMGEQMAAFDHLISQVEIYKNNIELTNMSLRANGQAVIDIDQQLGPLREQAIAMASDLRAALRAAGMDPAVVDLLVQHWIDGLKKIGAEGKNTASKLQGIADVMSKIGDTISAMSSVSAAITRGAQPNTTAFLSSVGSAAGSIGTAVAEGGTNPAADLQALASVMEVGNALTASTREIALEHKEILKQNNERLAEVSMRLVGFSVSAGTSGQAGQALAALFANTDALSKLASGATHTSGFFGTGKSGDLQTQIDALMPFLKQAGLTFDQFKKIALDNGFSILDKEGRLVTDALQQMKDHLQDVIRSLFTFQNTLSDQKSLSDLAQKLSGKPETPQDTVNRNLAIIQKLAPHLLPGGASAIGGQNQDALRKMLQDLLQKLVAGQVNPADLGGFQNLQELISIIDATAGSLNELRNVTNGVTAALTNIPTGFKLALLEFDAQDAMTRAQAGGTYGLTPTNPNPLGSGGITLNVEAGAIAIDPSNKNAAEIGQETLTALQALAGQKLGNRARWAGLN